MNLGFIDYYLVCVGFRSCFVFSSYYPSPNGFSSFSDERHFTEAQQRLDICFSASGQVLVVRSHLSPELSTCDEREQIHNFRIRIQLPKLWFILYLSNFILTCYHSTYLYLHTRWWMKMQISNLAKFIPGHIRGPLPNPRKLKVLIGACHWKKQIISWSAFRESESWWTNYKLKWAYIKSGGIKLFRICKNSRVMVNRDNIQVNWPTFHDFVPWSSKQFRTTNS